MNLFSLEMMYNQETTFVYFFTRLHTLLQLNKNLIGLFTHIENDLS